MKSSTLEASVAGHENNFNLIRLLAALCVLVSHAYPISLGAQEKEPLLETFGFTLGGLGVITFFSISGYFISASYSRSTSVIDFVLARVLRIFPGLIVVLLLAALLVGPIFTTLSQQDYWSNPVVYQYIWHGIGLKNVLYQLPGVFEGNPYPGINGSIWTLYYEVLLYCVVLVLGSVALLKTRRMVWVLVAYAVIYTAFKLMPAEAVSSMPKTQAFFIWSVPFMVGVMLQCYRQHLRISLGAVLSLLVASAMTHGTSWFLECFMVAWSMLVFYVGGYRNRLLLQYNRLGDYSYGFYIYAFLIQEIIAHCWIGSRPWQSILAATPLAFLMGVLSWYFVEKPAMRSRRWLTPLIESWLEKSPLPLLRCLGRRALPPTPSEAVR